MEEHFHKNELAKTECYGQIKRTKKTMQIFLKKERKRKEYQQNCLEIFLNEKEKTEDTVEVIRKKNKTKISLR